MSVFHGNWNEDAKAFLNSYLECMGSADDEKRARDFIYYLQAGSDADEWFEELLEEEKKSWATIEVLFRSKWLKQEVKGTKKVETIENGLQVLTHSSKITQKQVFSLHKPSKTLTLSYIIKGVPGLECPTGRWLVSPAMGREFFFWNPVFFGLKMWI
jgi:hypothetical protein